VADRAEGSLVDLLFAFAEGWWAKGRGRALWSSLHHPPTRVGVLVRLEVWATRQGGPWVNHLFVFVEGVVPRAKGVCVCV
jgi:hypothetical protein